MVPVAGLATVACSGIFQDEEETRSNGVPNGNPLSRVTKSNTMCEEYSTKPVRNICNRLRCLNHGTNQFSPTLTIPENRIPNTKLCIMPL